MPWIFYSEIFSGIKLQISIKFMKKSQAPSNVAKSAVKGSDFSTIDSAFEEESKRNNNNRSNSGASGSSLSTDRIYTAFSDHGVVELCMDLMTPGIEADLALGAMRVLIALLMKAGGNAVIQIAVYNYLKNIIHPPTYYK